MGYQEQDWLNWLREGDEHVADTLARQIVSGSEESVQDAFDQLVIYARNYTEPNDPSGSAGGVLTRISALTGIPFDELLELRNRE